MSNLWTPGYAQGFARSASEAENPGLWRGLAGMWVPALGPTGSVLRDVSAFQNHGTLTNMNPATNWVGSPHGWALTTTGGNAGIVVPNRASLNCTKCITVLIWYYSASIESGVLACKSQSSYQFRLEVSTAAQKFMWLLNVSGNTTTVGWPGVANGLDQFEGGWNQIVGTYDGTNRHLYINGLWRASNAITGDIQTNADTMSIGNKSNLGDASVAARYNLGQLYNRALTPSEIQQLYADPFAALRWKRRVFRAAAPSGLSIPIAMHHYKQLQGAA